MSEKRTSAHFARGSVVVVRGIIDEAFQTGGICDVKPLIVAADADDCIALWAPLGIPTMVARPLDPSLPRPWLASQCRLVAGTWRWRNALKISLPGQRWSTWVTWSDTWEFLGWYVNLQSLLCRTPIGFDVHDHQLDVLITPDRSWEWKDEADLARGVEIGQFTPDEARAIRASGGAAIAALEDNAAPFCDPWPDWRPPEVWRVPRSLPDWTFAP